MSTKRTEQQRAQGERTRKRLLAVARTELSRDGTASLNAIAKAAGVGIGTLYRHFPTRESLVFELYRHEVHELTAAADELLVDAEPAVALRRWLDRYAAFVMAKAGLVAVLRDTPVHGRFAQEAYRPVTEAIGRLIAANRAAGTIRPDVTADDVLLAVEGIYNLDPDGDWAQRTALLFDVVAAGLRPPR